MSIRRSVCRKPEGPTQVKPAEAVEPAEAEAAKARCEFQRDVFKSREGRISAADALTTVVTAAAAAVATVVTTVLREADGATPWILLVLALAAAAVFMSLLGRRETPVKLGKVRNALEASRAAVVAVHESKPSTPIAMYEQCFDAWLAMTTSAEAREKLKRAFYAASSIFLLAEVLLAALAIARLA